LSVQKKIFEKKIVHETCDDLTQQIGRKQFFESLVFIAQAIAQTFGSRCEVVVHDLADPEHSIVAIYGNLTGRKVGGAVTDLGLSLLESGSTSESVLTYETHAPNGRRLKSTSVLLRDQNGRLFGAFCINLDSEVMLQAAEFLIELCKVPTNDTVIEEHFSDDPVDVIAGIVNDELLKQGGMTDLHMLKREQRIRLVHALQERGVFNMRNAPTIVANLLGVSRFTIYNYLNEVRTNGVNDM
jgi:predicted transcriptional regulator YheO